MKAVESRRTEVCAEVTWPELLDAVERVLTQHLESSPTRFSRDDADRLAHASRHIRDAGDGPREANKGRPMEHSPIPESLGYFDTRWPHQWKSLPPDLDRLFRASPALADAVKGYEAATENVVTVMSMRRDALAPMAAQVAVARQAGFAALALLGDHGG